MLNQEEIKKICQIHLCWIDLFEQVHYNNAIIGKIYYKQSTNLYHSISVNGTHLIGCENFIVVLENLIKKYKSKSL